MTAIQSRPAVVRRRGAHHRLTPMPDIGEESRFVTSDGTALHVRTRGPADAPVTLVLVHGWAQDSRTWSTVEGPVEDAVGMPLRTVNLDLRGHGRSDPAPPGTVTIARLADDLAELIEDRVPHGPIVLAGHSMGGMTLMVLTERHPELVAGRVAAVAFVSTSSGDMDRITLGLPGFAAAGATRVDRRLATVLADRRGRHMPLKPAVARPGVRFLVFGKRPHPRRSDIDSVARQFCAAHPASAAGFRRAIAEHSSRATLSALRGTPVVVLVGELDRICPVRHARVIATELPDAEFVLYPGAGHMLPQERRIEVAHRIAGLVRTAAGQRAAAD